MAQRYLGSPNEELDLMFAELESIDRTTKEGRRAYNALARKIRRARGSRMFSGLRGLLSRKYPVPAGATGAASTMGVVGTPAISMPSLGTTAKSEPQIPIEEILVSAKKREVPVKKETPKAELEFDVSSKLGRNQLRSLQKRARRMRETPDAYERNPDYAIEFLPDYLKNQYRNELMQLAGRYNEGKTIEQGVMPERMVDPTDMALLGLGLAPIPGSRIPMAIRMARLGRNFKNIARPNAMTDFLAYMGTGVGLPAGMVIGLDKGMKKLKRTEGKTIEQLIEDKKQQEKSDERLEKFFEAYEKDPDAFSKDAEYYNMLEDKRNLEKKAGGGKLMGQAQRLAQAGRGDDTMLMHVTPDEVAGIASLAPGLMTINPQTGLPEAGLFRDILGFGLPFLLPMLAPGLGAVAAGALGGAGGAAIRGGDFKDILLGGATGALGGKLTEGLAQSGAQSAGLAENLASTTVDPSLSSVLTPDQLTQAQSLVTGAEGGMNLGSALGSMDLPASQMANINQALTPAIGDAAGQIGSLADMGGTGEIFGNIKSAGIGGLKDQLMSLEGIGTVTGMGLQAQRDMQRRYQDMLDNMSREKEEREAELYRMYPENIPYYAREGGSLYKKRYIDGDYS